MKHNLSIIILWVLLTLNSSIAAAFEISDSEKAWLASHQKIKVGLLTNAPPHSTIGEKGQLVGFDPDIVNYLNDMLSGRLEIVTGSWRDIYAAATKKQIDVLMSVTPSNERREYFEFTRPYISANHAIVGRESGPHFGNLEALYGYTVALVQKTFLTSYVRQNHPKIRIKEYESPLAGLKAVAMSDVDAFIGSEPAANFLILINDLSGLDIHGESNYTSETNVIAVRKDWPVLRDLLDRGLASIPSNELPSRKNDWSMRKIAMQLDGGVSLTLEEMNWLHNHPFVVAGGDPDWPPYDFFSNGSHTGFSSDYIRLLASKVGLEVQFITGYSWAQIIDKARKREIDILPSVLRNSEREEFLDFGGPYTESPISLVVNKKAKQINSLRDLSGKKIALVPGFTINKAILDGFPDIQVVYKDTPTDALLAVSDGSADGYVDYLTVINYLRKVHLIQELQIADIEALSVSHPLYIGIRNDWPLLTSILDKASKQITSGELEELRRRWLSVDVSDSNEFQLSFQEKKWLKSLGKLSIGFDRAWAPYSFEDDDGGLKGIATEYVRLIEEKLGIELEVRFGPWGDLIHQTRNDQLDLLPFAKETAERREFLTFTVPIMANPKIIGTRTDAPFYQRLADLKGLTVGVGEGFVVQKRLREDYPEVKAKGFDTIEEAIIALANGEIDAVLESSTVFTYYKHKHGLGEKIHINNMTEYETVQKIGVRHELAPLVPLLDRVLVGISPDENRLIIEKWITQSTEKETDWSTIWQILAVATCILMVVLFWNRMMAHEITRRREVEQNLEESKNLLRSVIDVIPSYIYAKNSAGKFILVNKNLSEFYRTTVDEMTGALHAGYCRDDGYIAGNEKDMRVIGSGQPLLLSEEPMKDPYGNEFVVETNRIPLIHKGETAVLVTATDISERKRSEAERIALKEVLSQSQKMESIGTLAGGIAHDFNNILSAILGYTELTLTDKELSGKSRRQLEQVLSAAKRAKELIRQILMFSRKEAEKRVPLQIHLVIEEAIKLLRQTIPTSITFKLDIDHNIGTVLADPTKLHQVVMNLGTNAYHAMRESGGELKIGLELCTVDNVMAAKYPGLKPGKFSLLTFGDSGTGISAETIARIFDPFFTTKPTGEGTGMGLAVVHGIIKTYGGAIGVESFPGEGSTFKVFLPLVEKEPSETGNAEKVVLSGSEHILVVDDEPILAGLMEELLKSLGYAVTATQSPKWAFEAISADPAKFDLLLTDQTMPEMTGDLLARTALKIHPGLPVIICTGYSDIIDDQKANEIGVRALLMKPVNLVSLSETIRRVLDESA